MFIKRKIPIILSEIPRARKFHANPVDKIRRGGRCCPRVRSDALATPSGVELVYEDAAREFDPTAPMDESVDERVSRRMVGGLGIALIGTLPSNLSYERINAINRTTLRFDR